MASLKDLQKYYNHEFENWGGVTSPDYRTFETKYINYLKSICKENGWNFIKANKNHYEFTAVMQRDDGQFMYFSISDVRYWFNKWYDHILIRTMQHDHDWTGGFNNYTNLERLVDSLKRLR